MPRALNGDQKRRENWIDVCRGIGILLVILGHCGSPWNRYIYGFHMPLFFLISGLLWNKNDSLASSCKKNINRYIVPYFILCFINLGLHCILSIIQHNDFITIRKYIIGIFYSRGTVEWMPNCSPLWFLTALFVALMFYGFIDGMQNSILKYTTILICCMISYSLSLLSAPKLIWNIDTALMAILYIAIGNWISKYNILNIMQELSYKWIAVLGLMVLSGVGIHFNSVETVSFDDQNYGNIGLMLLGSLSAAFVLMFVCKQLCRYCKVRFFEFFGQHTLFIMGFDYFSGTLSGMILGKRGNWITIVILKIIILSIGILIWNVIIEKIQNRKIREILTY